MTNQSEWVSCGVCNHCGKPIRMRPAESASGIVVTGAEPMEFIHEDMTTECRVVTVSKARPFSSIGKYKEYMRIITQQLENNNGKN